MPSPVVGEETTETNRTADPNGEESFLVETPPVTNRRSVVRRGGHNNMIMMAEDDEFDETEAELEEIDASNQRFRELS